LTLKVQGAGAAVVGERVVVEKTAENVGVAEKVVVAGEEKCAKEVVKKEAEQRVHRQGLTNKHILLKKIVLLEDIKLVVHLGINVK